MTQSHWGILLLSYIIIMLKHQIITKLGGAQVLHHNLGPLSVRDLRISYDDPCYDCDLYKRGKKTT
jgi:hypothetical protein